MRCGVPSRERLGRSERLLLSKDFRRVSRQASRVASRDFVLLIAPHDPDNRGLQTRRRGGARRTGPVRRLGITAGRKVGHAVARNRVKRGIREWFRRCRGELAEAVDVIVIARKSAAELSSAEMERVLCELVRRQRSESQEQTGGGESRE